MAPQRASSGGEAGVGQLWHINQGRRKHSLVIPTFHNFYFFEIVMFWMWTHVVDFENRGWKGKSMLRFLPSWTNRKETQRLVSGVSLQCNWCCFLKKSWLFLVYLAWKKKWRNRTDLGNDNDNSTARIFIISLLDLSSVAWTLTLTGLTTKWFLESILKSNGPNLTLIYTYLFN
jgi:hypothetical protein